MTHLIDGEFQSDKYPATPRGLVPLKPSDPMAQDLLWTYAQRRRSVDPEFADDLETALKLKGYGPTPDDDINRVLAETSDFEMVSGHRFRSALTELQSARAAIRKMAEENEALQLSAVPMNVVGPDQKTSYPTRAETFDSMVLTERDRQDVEFPPETNGKVHGPEVWGLVLGEEKGEIDRAILELRSRPRSNGLQLLKETVQLAASCRAFVEHDPVFSFLDPASEEGTR